jgi:ABC-type transport system involved in multi-copper enzyme maturation permease subunit
VTAVPEGMASSGEASLRRFDWRLWWAQARVVARIELRSILSPRAGFGLYFLAVVPVVILALHAILPHDCTVEGDTRVLAGLVQVYFLRLAIFFACLGACARLFRGEIVGRTLHHLFLAPIRREVVVCGKYLGAALGLALLFGLGLTATFALTYGHHGAAGLDFVWHGAGLGQLGAYLLVSTLACLGYGAVFLALGLVFRNPAVPAFLFFLWETFGGILPAWLQRLSVTFYLKPLLPIGLPEEGPGALFSVVVEPVPAWLAVAGLLIFALTVVALACWRVRRLEINYSTD